MASMEHSGGLGTEPPAGSM